MVVGSVVVGGEIGRMRRRLDGHDEKALGFARKESQGLSALVSPEIDRSDAVASSPPAKVREQSRKSTSKNFL